MDKTVDEDIISVDIANDASEQQRRRLMAYVERLREFKRAREPDKDRLSDLIIKAKGPKRSMRKFAEELGVDASTLSRLINQKTTGAINDKLLAAIAAHADPDSGVTIEALIEANGMVPKDARYQSEEAFEKACRDIIIAELEKRGNKVESAESERLKGAGFMMEYDFALQTDALKNGNGKWYFECKRPIPVGAGRLMQWLTMTMSLFYCGAVDAERGSIVVDRREVFKMLCERCKDVSIPDELSIILVDIQNQCVVDEFMLGLKGGEKLPEVFYDVSGASTMSLVPKLDFAWDMSMFDEK